MAVIPTRYRAKIPKTLAFPVGAELLSSALAGTPQEPSLAISFRDRSTLFASEFQQVLRTGGPLPVLRASYRNLPAGLSGSNDMVEAGYYDVTWLLDVYPVPAELKSPVRDQLRARGLGQVRAWLECPRPQTWQQGRHSLTLLFDSSTTSLLARED